MSCGVKTPKFKCFTIKTKVDIEKAVNSVTLLWDFTLKNIDDVT